VHDIDDQNGNVTERRTTGTQVGEGLVTRCIDDQETGHLELEAAVAVDHGRLLLDGVYREVGSTDLLGNTTSFALLDVGLSNLVEQLRLSGIDVTQNTADGRAQVVLGPRGKGSLVSLLSPLGGFLLALCLSGLSSRLLLILRLGLRLGLGLRVGVLGRLGSRGDGLGRLYSLIGLLIRVGGVPAVLDILVVRGGGSLPVVLDLTGLGLGGGLRGSLSLSLLTSSLVLGILEGLLCLLPSSLGSFGQGLLLIDLAAPLAEGSSL
jgi:hypothetical protein